MKVRIVLMGGFQIEADGVVHDDLLSRSRKGSYLIRYLILQRGKTASYQRLNRELKTEHHSENPESAMKTLICRTRSMLNKISPGLGKCIVSLPGGYKWESLPGARAAWRCCWRSCAATCAAGIS